MDNNENNPMQKKLGPTVNFFKGISPMLKLAAWLFGIQIVISLLSVVMVTDGESSSELISLLSVVMALSMLCIDFFMAKSAAYADFQTYKNNLIRLKRKEELPNYRKMQEYKPFNGVIAALISCLPSILLAGIGIIQNPIVSSSNIFGKIGAIINLAYIVPINNLGGANSLYFVFIGVVLTTIASGIGYFIQGEKLRYQFEELQSRSR